MLFDYQKKYYISIRDSLESGTKSVLFTSAVGTGKSYIARQLIQNIYLNKGLHVLYVLPTYALIEHVKDLLPNVDYVTYAFFTNLQTARETVQKYDLIVADEAHHLGSPVYGLNLRRVVSSAKCQLLGLTATPVRSDSIDVRQYFNSVVEGLTQFECIQKGMQPRFKYFVCSPKVSFLTEMQRKRLSIDYASSMDFLADIIRSQDVNKWLVFNRTINQLNDCYDLVQKALPEYTCVKLYSDMSDTDDSNREALEAFSKHERVIVFSCNMLLEGLHVPDVYGAILMRNIQSPTVFQQILGRVSHMNVEKHPVIIDCAAAATNIRWKRKFLKLSTTTDEIRTSREYRDLVERPLATCKLFDIMQKLESLKVSDDVPVEVNLKQYKDLYTFCIENDIPYMLAETMRKTLSPKETAETLLSESEHSFIVKGCNYGTFEAFLNAFELSSSRITMLPNMSLEQSCEAFLCNNMFWYNGVAYATERVCARKLGIPLKVLRQTIRERNCSVTEALDFLTKNINDFQFSYGGKFYKDAQDCCSKLGVNFNDAVNLVNKCGMTYATAIKSLTSGFSKRTRAFKYKGKTYPSFAYYAHEHNIPTRPVYNIRARTGLPLNKALEYYLSKQ